MAFQIIPTLNDGTARYNQVVALDGRNYILKFDWNAHASAWFLSIHTFEDEPIFGCLEQKLVAEWYPARLSTSPDRPSGRFLLITDDGLTDPGLRDLGSKALLVYQPEADFDV